MIDSRPHFRGLCLAALLLVAMNSCGGPNRSQPLRLACNPILGQELPIEYTSYYGAVALPTAPLRPRALQTSRSVSDLGVIEYFAKAAIMFRGSHPTAVEVVGSPKAALNWEGRSKRAITATGCDWGDREWSHVVGGFVVMRPQCLTLKISNGSEST